MTPATPQPHVTGPAREFGEYLRRQREAKGLSLRAFCQGVQLSIPYVSQLERGQARMPADETIVRMAQVLDEDPDILLSMAGRVSRVILAKLWSAGLMPGVLSQATGWSAEKAAQIAKNVADYAEGQS